jgi:oxygen-dependent protoporphyrinogen oxidase
MALLRTMAGGARNPAVAELDDRKLSGLVLSELRDITGLKSDPEFIRIYRHEHAIPQYNLGHGALLRAVDALEQKHKGVYVTGNAYRGVSFNDCIANSMGLAERISMEMG